MADPVFPVGAQSSPVPQSNNSDSGFQAAVQAAKLWHWKSSGSMASDKEQIGHFGTDVNVAAYNASTSGEFGKNGAEFKASANVTGIDMKFTNNYPDEARPYGVGGRGEIDSRVEVAEAGVNLTANKNKLEAGANAGVIGGEVSAKGSAGFYPSRWLEGTCNWVDGQHSQFSAIANTCKTISKYDYGVEVNGQIGATVGLAVKAEGGGEITNGHIGAHYKWGLATGVGPSNGAGISLGRFDR